MEFNQEDHTYHIDGMTFNRSVSELASFFKKPFPKDIVAKAVAKRDGIYEEDVIDKWDLNCEIAQQYGNSIHKAIEYWIKYDEIPKQIFLKKVVEEFKKKHGKENTHSEMVVYDKKLNLCGTMDLLKVTGKKTANIEDIKTNADLFKEEKSYLLEPFNDLKATKINEYRLQLSIYKHLMELLGWKIEKLILWHYTDKWEKIEIEPINLEKLWKKYS